jgi:hypothetical protein
MILIGKWIKSDDEGTADRRIDPASRLDAAPGSRDRV